MSAHTNCGAINQRRDCESDKRNNLQPAEWDLVTARQIERKVNLAQPAAQKIVQEDREAHCQCSRRSSARDQELRPAIKKSPDSSISVPSNYVFGACVWTPRGKFGVVSC